MKIKSLIAIAIMCAIASPALAKKKATVKAKPKVEHAQGNYTGTALLPPLPPKCAQGELLFRVTGGVAVAVCGRAIGAK